MADPYPSIGRALVENITKPDDELYPKGWSVQSLNEFEFFGIYYCVPVGDSVFPCRAVLDIVRKGSNRASRSPTSINQAFDLLVVMMNPGSSLTTGEISSGFVLRDCYGEHSEVRAAEPHPDGCYIRNRSRISNLKSWKVVPKPDDVQGIICRLLLNLCLQRARVVNLIDIRHPDSQAIGNVYNKAESVGFSECSIFNPSRCAWQRSGPQDSRKAG